MHGVLLFLVDFKSFEVFFSVLCVFDGFVVSGASLFDDIVVVFGVGFERDFAVAVGALEVEAEDLDAEIGLFVADLHAHVELGADVQVVGADVAPQRHWQHVAHHHQLVLASAALHDSLVVEVFGEILDEHLALCHLL